MATKKAPPPSTERIVVVFGSERLGELWARRNAYNPRKVMLATHGADKLMGHQGPITTVRFASDIWEPVSSPCANRVREVEDAIKRHKKMGGEVNDYVEG
jgi:hypothetical protein